MNILLFDVESTGLKPEKSFIISNGAILYNTKNKTKSEFYELLDWSAIYKKFFIPEDTIKVHGITEEELSKNGIDPMISMNNFYNWIEDFLNKNENDSSNLDACVAFNLPYDLNMYISNLKCLNEKFSNNYDEETKLNVSNLLNLLTKNYKQQSGTLFIDSLIIDQIFHFEVDGEKVYHNLDAVGNRYGFESDPNAHNAIADTRRMFEVFKIQLNELQEKGISLDQEFENRLIRKYDRNQSLWKKPNSLDYLANNMKSTLL